MIAENSFPRRIATPYTTYRLTGHDLISGTCDMCDREMFIRVYIEGDLYPVRICRRCAWEIAEEGECE